MFEPISLASISFYTGKTLEESKKIIINIINRDGGQIRIQNDSVIVAGFGSNAKLRLLGPLGGLKFLPRDVIVDMERVENKTLIKVNVQDTMGFGSRIGLTDKYQEMMKQNALTVKAAFPDAMLS